MHYYGQTGKLSADREIGVQEGSQTRGSYVIRLLPDILYVHHQIHGLEIS